MLKKLSTVFNFCLPTPFSIFSTGQKWPCSLHIQPRQQMKDVAVIFPVLSTAWKGCNTPRQATHHSSAPPTYDDHLQCYKILSKVLYSAKCIANDTELWNSTRVTQELIYMYSTYSSIQISKKAKTFCQGLLLANMMLAWDWRWHLTFSEKDFFNINS